MNRYGKKLRARDGDWCKGVCEKKLKFHKKGRVTVDHIVPIALGGETSPRNLQLMCPPCNFLKGNLTMEEFLRRHRRRGRQNLYSISYAFENIKLDNKESQSPEPSLQ